LVDYPELLHAQTLGESVRRARRSECLKLREAAGQAISLQALSLIELGRVVPRLDTLDYITRRLRRPPGHFYELYISMVDQPKRLLEACSRLTGWRKFDLAAAALDKALSLARAHPDDPLLAGLLSQQVRLTGEAQGCPVGLEHGLNLLDRYGDETYPFLACRLKTELARLYLKLSKYPEGYRQVNKALTLYRLAAVPDERLYRRIVHNMGWLSWRVHLIDEATECFERTLGLAQEYGDATAMADARHGLAMCLWTRGELEEALHSIDEAISHLSSPDLAQPLGSAYNNKGLILYDLGRKREALEHYDKAIALWTPLSPPYERRYVAFNERGRTLYDLNELDQAAETLEQAWTALERSDNCEEVVRNLMYRADVARCAGDYDHAVDLLRRAIGTGLEHPKITPLLHVKVADAELDRSRRRRSTREALRTAIRYLERRERR